MFESYAIGVSLRLNNLISPQLTVLAKEFKELDSLTLALNTSLRNIGSESAGLRSIAAAGNASNRALQKAGISAAAFERHLAAIKLNASSMPAIPLVVGGGATGGGGAGGGNGRGGGLVPAVPGGAGQRGGGGGRGGGGFHGGNIHMGPRGIGLGTVGMAAGDLFVPLAVTAAAAYGAHALYESAKDLNTEKERFKLFGLTDRQNREAFQFVSGMHIYGSTQTQNMAGFREAQGVFRESGESGSAALEGAKIAAPVLAKLNFLASSLDEESGARVKTANLAMLRYVEASGGLKSPQEFNRIADFGYKLNTSSGGTINWEQLRQFKARAGAAGFNLTDDAMARLEPTIAESKGSTTGYGLRTAYNRLTGVTRIPNQVLHELMESGVWDKSKIILNSAGGVKSFTDPRGPMSKDKIDLLSTNPELFYETYIRPIYSKMRLDAAEIARQNAMIFGGTGGANATLWEKQIETIHRGIEALNKTKGIDAAYVQAQGALTGQEKEFGAAWTDFKTQWGNRMLPFFTGILKGGSSILRSASPDKVRDEQGKPPTWLLWMGRTMAFLGSKQAQDALDSVTRHGSTGSWAGTGGSTGSWGDGPIDQSRDISPYIALPSKQKIQVDVHNKVDRNGLTTFVLQGIDKHLAAPQTGLAGFDGSMHLSPAGGVGGS